MKRNFPLSVLMPTYNNAKYLSIAIDSILEQTFSDYEFIIADDGSSDNTSKILREYVKRDSRIRTIKNPKNLGRAGARNSALTAKPKGDFIAIMDSDDISMPDRFSKQIHFLKENPNIVALGTQVMNVDENNNATQEQTHLPETHASLIWTMLYSVPFCNPSVMMRKRAATSVGQYKIDSPVEDAEYWTRLAFKGKFANLPETLLHYRMPSKRLIKRLGDWKIPVLNVSKAFIGKILGYSIDMTDVEFIKASVFHDENLVMSSKETIKIIELLGNIRNSMRKMELLSENDMEEVSHIMLAQCKMLLNYSAYFRMS